MQSSLQASVRRNRGVAPGAPGAIVALLRVLLVGLLSATVISQASLAQSRDEKDTLDPPSSSEATGTTEAMPQSDHSQHSQHAGNTRGLYGDYEMTRESTGTSWQPDSSPMRGYLFRKAGMDIMFHGFVDVGWQDDDGPRGTSDSFSTSMLMLNAGKQLGSGRLGLRFMGSVEPAMGKTGYPVLFQTGETSDGINPLIDRQHPHDVLMELAATYSLPLGGDQSLFFYFAPVGEPAIGPGAFMHRESAMPNPVAPIGHHWMDATHITYGVITMGWLPSRKVKVEASVFNGREPDQERWNVEAFRLDSYALRFTANPHPDWSLQASVAELNEPERLHTGIDFVRFTASLSYNRPMSSGNWQTTAIWGRNKRKAEVTGQSSSQAHVHALNNSSVSEFGNTTTRLQSAVLVESSLRFKNDHRVFGRFEWAEKDELFRPSDRRHSLVFNVNKAQVGYAWDFLEIRSSRLTVGAAISFHSVPADLELVYGSSPKGLTGFLRLQI